MKHIKSYSIYESGPQDANLITVAEGLVGGLPWWSRAKARLSPQTLIHIDTEGERSEEAHYDMERSTPQRVVILMDTDSTSSQGKSSLAHEITHAIQWLTDSYGDLAFITDATRDLIALSTSSLWERLLYAIYLSCPQELQAWQAGALYYKEPILGEMLPWMGSFDPIASAQELSETKLDTNQWDLEGFDELPSFWSEAYKAYGEGAPGSGIPSLEQLTLEEFLIHYDKAFKEAYRTL